MGSGGSHTLWSPGGPVSRLRVGTQPCWCTGVGAVVVLACRVCLRHAAHRLLGCYMVKPHGPLVPVSCTDCCASPPGLPTWWASTALEGARGSGEGSSRAGPPAAVLSAVIPSAHSYPAVPLA